MLSRRKEQSVESLEEAKIEVIHPSRRGQIASGRDECLNVEN